MQNEQGVQRVIGNQGILPLFYHDDSNICLELTRFLYAAGIRCIEFTNRGGQALNNFKQLVKSRDAEMKDMLLAIGTIKTGDDASRFIDAGADCLISPVFDATVCDTAYLNKILWIPGCMTPTEIDVAQKAGCTTLKLFPGNVLGPGFVEAIQPLFTGLKYIVTGGVDVTEESLRPWFKAGVTGVGLGSKLITRQLIEDSDYKGLQSATENVLSIIQKLRMKQAQ